MENPTFTRIRTGNDILIGGYNTTNINRELIIRFYPKQEDGTVAKRSRLITGRQLVEMLMASNRGKTMASVWGRITRFMEDKLVVNLRATGRFEFVWR